MWRSPLIRTVGNANRIIDKKTFSIFTPYRNCQIANIYNGTDHSSSLTSVRSFSSRAVSSVSPEIDSDPSSVKASFRKHLEKQRERALAGGGEKRIQKQHARGSLTARERLNLFFDAGSFCEMDQLKVHRTAEFGMDSEENRIPGDGVVTGHGTVNGRTVFAFSQDFTGMWVYTMIKSAWNSLDMVSFPSIILIVSSKMFPTMLLSLFM